MEKKNNNNEIKSEPQIEEMDSDFLKELNQLSKQLKTDEEIINEYKSKSNQSQVPKSIDNNNNNNNNNTNSKDDNNKKYESNKNNNINYNVINNSDINDLFQNNKNGNDNPFNEAFNIMNSKENNFFNLEENNLMFEALNSFSSNLNQFNSILNKAIDINDNNDSNNNKSNNDINDDKIEEKLMSEIFDFLIQSDMLKNTILNMRNSIEKSFKKNENDLKKDEKEKYNEALLNADNILNELNKIYPDKNIIMDSIQKLKKISNDIDSILVFNKI
jgi:hypothetical protein